MNKKLSLGIVIVVVVLLIAGASVLYTLLTNPETMGDTPGALITGTSGQESPGQEPAGNLELAPDFEMLDSNGNTVRLSDYAGQPIVLNYWASWCPPCVAELPDFEKLYKEYGSEVQFIMLNSTDSTRETVEHATGFARDQGFTFPLFFDISGEAAYVNNITSIPQTFFINKDGYLVSYRIGMLSESDLRSGIASIG